VYNINNGTVVKWKHSGLQNRYARVEVLACEAPKDLLRNFMSEEGSVPSNVEALSNKLLRALADLDNLRKRAAFEREQFAQFANQALIAELLPVLDGFGRAIAAAKESEENIWVHIKTVEVEKAAVELLIINSGPVPPEVPAIDNRAATEDVPIPVLPRFDIPVPPASLPTPRVADKVSTIFPVPVLIQVLFASLKQPLDN